MVDDTKVLLFLWCKLILMESGMTTGFAGVGAVFDIGARRAVAVLAVEIRLETA